MTIRFTEKITPKKVNAGAIIWKSACVVTVWSCCEIKRTRCKLRGLTGRCCWLDWTTNGQGHIDPDAAWAGVDESLPIICLNHNPVNVPQLMKWPWQWMLSGHTHGRQVATSRFGRRFYGHRYRHYTKGYYAIEGRHLYVNRGLSYGQRIYDWCKPEVTVFRLTQEEITDSFENSVERPPSIAVR